ncbi:MAG: hypothetical protein HY093_04810 [Candidatus Liptonbacteria bacterium]|nr:hypothetical protein [Candidatus Liptonbacteria bacterium]
MHNPTSFPYEVQVRDIEDPETPFRIKIDRDPQTLKLDSKLVAENGNGYTVISFAADGNPIIDLTDCATVLPPA